MPFTWMVQRSYDNRQNNYTKHFTKQIPIDHKLVYAQYKDISESYSIKTI